MAENMKPAKRGEKDASAGKAAARANATAARRRGGAFKGLNLFDAIVVLLVLVVVVMLGVGVRVSDLFGNGEVGTSTVSYTLTISDVDQAYANAIHQGDTIYDVDTGALLGKVVSMPIVKPHTEIALLSSENGTGIAQETAVPGRVDITVAVRGQVQYQEGKGYFADACAIRVGATYSVRFPNFLGSARCVSFDGVSLSRIEEGVK